MLRILKQGIKMKINKISKFSVFRGGGGVGFVLFINTKSLFFQDLFWVAFVPE
jgi:hypothetical protein